MVPQLVDALASRWAGSSEAWVLLTEQQTETRVPDAVLARIDLDALSARVNAGLTRALTRTELLGVQATRPNRAASLSLLAQRMMVTEHHAGRLVRRLAGEGFLLPSPSGSFFRHPALSPIVTRLVTFEAKRDDWRSALVQAAAHRRFAHVSYVVCDEAFAQRFRANLPAYHRAGVGLLALEADRPSELHKISVARANRSVDRLAYNVACEEIWKTLRGLPLRKPRQTTLPNVGAPTVDRAPRLLLGPRPSTRAQTRVGRGRRALGLPLL